jgi:hypothetical protein
MHWHRMMEVLTLIALKPTNHSHRINHAGDLGTRVVALKRLLPRTQTETVTATTAKQTLILHRKKMISIAPVDTFEPVGRRATPASTRALRS